MLWVKVVDGFEPAKLEQGRNVRYITVGKLVRGLPLEATDSETVQKIDSIFQAKVPIFGRGTGAVHNGIYHFLDFLDATFSVVLMLVVGFTLGIINTIFAKNFKGMFANLGFGVITHKGMRSTVGTDKVFKCRRELGFLAHRKNSGDLGGATNEQLSHGSATMSKDTVVVGGRVREEGVGGNNFIHTLDIESRETGTIVFTLGKARINAGKLGRVVESLLDAFNRDPTKVSL
jgi:hypothetical protein